MNALTVCGNKACPNSQRGSEYADECYDDKSRGKRAKGSRSNRKTCQSNSRQQGDRECEIERGSHQLNPEVVVDPQPIWRNGRSD